MLVVQALDRAQVVGTEAPLVCSARGLGPGARGHRAPTGLDEHVLALGLMSGDGEVVVPVLAAAAAVELELAPTW